MILIFIFIFIKFLLLAFVKISTLIFKKKRIFFTGNVYNVADIFLHKHNFRLKRQKNIMTGQNCIVVDYVRLILSKHWNVWIKNKTTSSE